MTGPGAEPAGGWRLAVVMPTLGRAVTARKVIQRLARQTRPADRILVVGVSRTDVAGLEDASTTVETYLAPKGSCSQRNFALDRIEGEVDLVVFLDDDYVPAHDVFAKAERFFKEHPDVAGLCGRPIADGAHGPGIPFDEAEALVAGYMAAGDIDETVIPVLGLYGCNMIVRASAMAGVRFDETLPLYGWQEDFDFSHKVGARGRLVRWRGLVGVHMGEKSGKGSGKRFGYSQVANPLYLLGRRRMPRERALRLVRNNVASNLIRSLRPEPYIDRRGRLLGNLLALTDLVQRRLDPRRILEFE